MQAASNTVVKIKSRLTKLTKRRKIRSACLHGVYSPALNLTYRFSIKVIIRNTSYPRRKWIYKFQIGIFIKLCLTFHSRFVHIHKFKFYRYLIICQRDKIRVNFILRWSYITRVVVSGSTVCNQCTHRCLSAAGARGAHNNDVIRSCRDYFKRPLMTSY